MAAVAGVTFMAVVVGPGVGCRVFAVAVVVGVPTDVGCCYGVVIAVCHVFLE